MARETQDTRLGLADLLIHNALVLTLEPGAPPLAARLTWPSGAAGLPRWGRRRVPEDLPPAREILDVPGALVLPGLVNTHCHAPMVWFRGLADDLPLHQWLTEVIFPAESGWLTPERVYLGALLAAAEMIRGGVTTVADGYFYEAKCAGPWPRRG